MQPIIDDGSEGGAAQRLRCQVNIFSIQIFKYNTIILQNKPKTMCRNSLYNYTVKLTGLTEFVGLFLFSQIWRGDKIVCVKRPGVWGMINISGWHLCYNGSFTSRLDMTPQYLFENVQTDWQTISMLWDKLGCDLVTWATGIIFQAVSIISQSSHHFTVSLTFSHKYLLVIGLKITKFWVCLVVHIVKVEQWRQLT